jgi:hypothetical protein
MPQSDSKVLYVKPGGTYGAAPASWLGSDAIRVFDLTARPLDAQMVERTQVDPQGSGRIVKPAITGMFGTLEFSTYALASGTAGTGPLIAPLLAACGANMSTVTGTSNTFSLATLNSEPGFIDCLVNHGGDEYKFYGARGNCEITYASGALSVFKYTFEGIYVPPAPGAVIAPSYGTSALDVVVDATNTATFNLGTSGSPISMEFTTFTLNFGNTLARIDNGGGTKRVTISGRQPTASMTVRHKGLATFNPFALAAGETENACTLVHGAAGARQTITLPRFTYGSPGIEDSNNEVFYSLEAMLSRDPNSLNFFSIKYD